MNRLSRFALVFFAWSASTASAQSVHLHPESSSLQTSVQAEPSHAHHPVSTANLAAQRQFDQGLALIYAFNYTGAKQAFTRATELDSTLAMAWWGVALSRGSFINHQITPKDLPAADSAIQQALRRPAPAHERALIEALAARYSLSTAMSMAARERQYSAKMAGVAARYPDDLDVQTLYAESIMNLHPWKLWHADGTPETGTLRMVSVLEQVLARDPHHVGANHYYIHAVEASKTPERALPSADRLHALQHSRASVHLAHMPTHAYLRTGAYARAVSSGLVADSIAGPFMHNLDFLMASRSMLLDSAAAQRSAVSIAAEASRLLTRNPSLELYLAAPVLMLVRYARWHEVLALPVPDSAQRNHRIHWQWARAMALANTDNSAVARAAQREHRVLVAAMREPDPELFRRLHAVWRISDLLLTATIAVAERRFTDAVTALDRGILVEDALDYSEPPDWLFPLREALGHAQLTSGNFRAAERAFRDELRHRPRSPRALNGLAQSLRAQGRVYEASVVEAQLLATAPA